MVGTLNPPSKVVCFPHNRGPLEPAISLTMFNLKGLYKRNFKWLIMQGWQYYQFTTLPLGHLPNQYCEKNCHFSMLKNWYTH